MDTTFYPYFTISVQVHIVLAVLALLVFGSQFIRSRKWYYLVLTIALPCTLLPRLSNSQTFFNIVGVCEGVALLLAFLLSRTVDRKKSQPVQEETPSPHKDGEKDAS